MNRVNLISQLEEQLELKEIEQTEEEHYINNEGFDQVVDMTTARTEKDMNWLSQCCFGAPTPKELADEYLYYPEEMEEEFIKEIEEEMNEEFNKNITKSK